MLHVLKKSVVLTIVAQLKNIIQLQILCCIRWKIPEIFTYVFLFTVHIKILTKFIHFGASYS